MVVGISADYRIRSVGEGPQPYIHLAETQRPGSFHVLLARTRGDAGRLLADIRREMLAIEPRLVFIDNQTMENQVSTTLLPVRAGAWILSALGLVAMALAGIGLYGVISFSVARRTREIGIRMALGATRSSVLGLVMRQGLKVACVGLAAGFLLAAGASRLMSGVLYGVGAGDLVAWLGAAGVILLASMLANLAPAHRASRIDPSAAMRAE